MNFNIKNPLLSAFFAALAPYFNKQATLDEKSPVYKYFIEKEVRWAIYPFDVVCLILMLWSNTIAVKYRMLSYMHDGAFIGTSLIFILGYLFSSGFDYLHTQSFLSMKQTLGICMMTVGILLISYQEEENKVRKRATTVFDLIQDADLDESDSISKEKVGAENCDLKVSILDKNPDSEIKIESGIYAPDIPRKISDEATLNHPPSTESRIFEDSEIPAKSGPKPPE